MNKNVFVFSTDDNYTVPTYVAIHSLMKHSNRDEEYCVYILISKDLSSDCKDLIDSISRDFQNLSLSFINMGNSFSDTKLVIKHTTLPSMYRLLLPELLPDSDRCVYIDGDIIVTGDMASVFDIDISDHYFGAVRDIEAMPYISKFDYSCDRPDPSGYVNSGMLYMNLKKMRQDDLVSKFLELSKERLFFGDQDILNIVCKDNIKFLELKYNVLVKYRFVNHKQDHYSDFVSQYFQTSEIHEAIDTPVMIHYAQPTKPWQCRYVYKGEVWYGYIHKNINKDIYSKYILPYINSHKADRKVSGKLFRHWILYKAGILKPLLNLQHKL